MPKKNGKINACKLCGGAIYKHQTYCNRVCFKKAINTPDNNGETPAQKRVDNIAKRMKVVDEESGKSLSQLRAEKSAKTKEDTVINGKTIHEIAGAKTKEKNSQVDPKTGKSNYEIASVKAINTRLHTITDNGLTIEENRIKKWLEGQIAKGNVTPFHLKDDQEIYYTLSNWQYRMYDYTTGHDRELYESLGVFNSVSNKTGVVRDHRYGRREGFKNKVFPEILRHPSNLQILGNIENLHKGSVYNVDSDITLDELFSLIECFSGEWDEHELCLTLIANYRNGARYDKEDYTY